MKEKASFFLFETQALVLVLKFLTILIFSEVHLLSIEDIENELEDDMAHEII
jgi:hypothetical protein